MMKKQIYIVLAVILAALGFVARMDSPVNGSVPSAVTTPEVLPEKSFSLISNMVHREPVRRVEAKGDIYCPPSVEALLVMTREELVQFLSSTTKVDSLITGIFLLGNNYPIGAEEVNLLVGILGKWEDERVQCQVIETASLSREYYPLAVILAVYRSSALRSVRRSAVASMGRAVEGRDRYGLASHFEYETDPVVLCEISKYFPDVR